jgi:hypothetical protein
VRLALSIVEDELRLALTHPLDARERSNLSFANIAVALNRNRTCESRSPAKSRTARPVRDTRSPRSKVLLRHRDEAVQALVSGWSLDRRRDERESLTVSLSDLAKSRVESGRSASKEGRRNAPDPRDAREDAPRERLLRDLGFRQRLGSRCDEQGAVVRTTEGAAGPSRDG